MKEEFIGITDARDRLKELVESLEDRDVVILRHNRPVARIVPPERFEGLIDRIEDLEDYTAVLENRLEEERGIPQGELEASLEGRSAASGGGGPFRRGRASALRAARKSTSKRAARR